MTMPISLLLAALEALRHRVGRVAHLLRRGPDFAGASRDSPGPLSLKASETVEIETPAIFATSRMVAI